MKSEITRELAKIISTVRCHGEFYATGQAEIVMPNLEVDGVGRIALPLLPVQAEQLIAIATRAPYGRGEATLVDTNVRRTWQIDAERIHLTGRSWPDTLDAIVGKAAAGLGVTGPVRADLYKLLIYDAGSFFVEHRDTEKVPGMFATLVVALPSTSSGGELIVRHRGHEVSLDLGCSDSAAVSYAAFYADCVHEVRPVTSGFRMVLIFNLARTGGRQPSAPPAYESEQSAITAVLRRWAASRESSDDTSPEKLIYPLEHAYTPAELAFAALKNADAAAAGVLVRAAEEADCDLHLALVSIDESGSAEYSGYASRRRSRWYRDDDEDADDDDFEIGEIIERTLSVSDWRRPDDSEAAIHTLPFDESELCPPGSFSGLEPDEQHFHEATGNEGASFERTYRRAAFVLWPRTRRLAVLNQAGLEVTLPYLSDLAQRWSKSGEDQDSPRWREAHTLAGYMLRDWPASRGACGSWDADRVVVMLESLAQLRDVVHIDAFLADVPLKWLYHGSENEALARAARLLQPERAAGLIERIIAQNAQMRTGACAGFLSRMAADARFAGSPDRSHLCAEILVETLTGQRASPERPGYLQWPDPIGADLIDDLVTALEKIDAQRLAGRTVEHVLGNPASFDMDAIVMPAVLTLSGRTRTANTDSVRRLRAACVAHLRSRIAQPLAPPADFARENTIACRCAHCSELGQFLVDPTRKEWVFKAAEGSRSHVERSIGQYGCDVDCTTSRLGRPYSLVCRKNEASYKQRVRQRKDDLHHLERLEAVAGHG